MNLLEIIIAGMLSCMIAGTSVAVLHSQSRVAEQTSLRSERNDGIRAAFLTLDAELSAVEPRVDVRAIGRDSISARIFRGRAVVCGYRDSLTLVRYRGLRSPDAAKDSALQIGVENVFRVDATVSAAGCVREPDEDVFAVTLQKLPPLGSIWLIFEHGTYQLSTHALRYRRHAESRQPITPEIVDVPGSKFVEIRDTIVRGIDIRLRDRRFAAESHGFIRFGNSK